MTFDELCKAVKKANDKAEVIKENGVTKIGVSDDLIVAIPEVATKRQEWRREFYVVTKQCQTPGFSEIVAASAEYDNTDNALRGLEPLWFISVPKTEWSGMYSYVSKNYLSFSNAQGKQPTWYWGSRGEASPFTKKQIKEYLEAGYGEEKAEQLVDDFIKVVGERVQ